MTANDVALARASNQIDAASQAIADDAAHMIVALVLAAMCAVGVIVLVALARRSTTSRQCEWCRRRMHIFASVCPHCQRDTAVDPARDGAVAEIVARPAIVHPQRTALSPSLGVAVVLPASVASLTASTSS